MTLTALLCGLVTIFTGSVLSEDPQIRQQDIETLVKRFKDAKFWIINDGVRTGWVRYQCRWEELDGERLIRVEYERAGFHLRGDRFTAWLMPTERLTPRLVRWGTSSFGLRSGKGYSQPGTFPRRPYPEDLTLFPELVATLSSLKQGTRLSFSQHLPGDLRVVPGGKLEVAGEGDLASSDGSTRRAVRVNLSASKAPLDWESVVWLTQNREILKIERRVSYASSKGDPRELNEYFLPVGTTEWSTQSIELNHIRALAALCLLEDVATRFRQHDIDRNDTNDYWTGDVSGLFRLKPPDRAQPLRLIPRELAMADHSPFPKGNEGGGGYMSEQVAKKPVALHGYFFKSLKREWANGRFVTLSTGNNRSSVGFGFCAFPQEYGKTGVNTMFNTSRRSPVWKDLGGKGPDDMPNAKPNQDGWKWNGPRQ